MSYFSLCIASNNLTILYQRYPCFPLFIITKSVQSICKHGQVKGKRWLTLMCIMPQEPWILTWLKIEFFIKIVIHIVQFLHPNFLFFFTIHFIIFMSISYLGVIIHIFMDFMNYLLCAFISYN